MTPLTPREIFDAYVRDRRSQAIHGFRCDVLDHVVRYTPLRPELEGFIVFANLDESNVDAAIKAQVEHFENIDAGFEWKVYEFDPPASLPQRLTAHAFNPGDLEAFMVYPTSEHRSRPLRAGVTIERVESRDGIRTVVKLQTEIWHEDLAWLEQCLVDDLAETMVLLARVDGKPVGTGWINFTPGSAFADLHGGAVLPEFRGRGAYSALFDLRADEARRRGVPYLTVDAAPMSRPILLRQGFQFVCTTRPYRRRSKRGVPVTAATSAPGG